MRTNKGIFLRKALMRRSFLLIGKIMRPSPCNALHYLKKNLNRTSALLLYLFYLIWFVSIFRKTVFKFQMRNNAWRAGICEKKLQINSRVGQQNGLQFKSNVGKCFLKLKRGD